MECVRIAVDCRGRDLPPVSSHIEDESRLDEKPRCTARWSGGRFEQSFAHVSLRKVLASHRRRLSVWMAEAWVARAFWSRASTSSAVHPDHL